jgi:hypothetical protein
MRALSGLLGLLYAFSAPLAAQTVIYRCSGADGSLALQSMPCPKGSSQQVRTLSDDYATAPVMPAADTPQAADTHLAPAAGSVVTAPPTQRPRTAVPLPALHHCRPRHGEAYFTDRLEDTVRCVPMRVSGLDGNPATGAGQVCSGWNDYLVQSRQRWDSAPSRSSSERDTASTQIAAVLAASECAAQP